MEGWLESLGKIGKMSGCVPCIPEYDDPTSLAYGPTHDCSGGGGEPSRPPPDRRSFERQLSDLNNRLGERGKVLQETREEIRRLAEQRRELRRLCEDGRTRSKALDKPIDEAEASVAERRKEMHQMELELPYTRSEPLEKKLEQVERAYHQRTFNNAKEEETFVAQIDKLKRNKRRLTAYLDALAERNVLEKKLKELRDEQKAANRFFHHKQFQLRNVKKQRLKLLQKINGDGAELEGLGSEVYALERNKRQLIERYNSEAAEYRRACPQRRRQTRPKSAPFTQRPPPLTHQKRKEEEPDDEDDGLELFYEQKQLCRNLLAYLHGLLEHCDESVLAEASLRPNPSTDSQLTPTPSFAGSSTESGPPEQPSDGGLRRQSLKVSEDLSEASASTNISNRKRNSRKKRGNASISIDGIMFNAFHRLGITGIPGTYAEVPAMIQQVEAELASYESQTEVSSFLDPREWSAEERPHFVEPASSDTSRTTDSAWGSHSQSFSDVGSLSQLSFRSVPEDGASTSPSAPGPLPSFLTKEPSASVPTTPGDVKGVAPRVHISPDSSSLRRALNTTDSSSLQRSHSDEGPVSPPADLEREGTLRVADVAAALPKASDEGIGACSKDSSASSASQAHEVLALRKSLSDEKTIDGESSSVPL